MIAQRNRKFPSAIDGFDPVAADITVLGTNSKQVLIDTLASEKLDSKNTGTRPDASTVEPFGN